VWMKSSPLKSKGSLFALTKAYAKQSPKLRLAGCPLPLPIQSDRLNPDARFFEQLIEAPTSDRIAASVDHEGGFNKVRRGHASHQALLNRERAVLRRRLITKDRYFAEVSMIIGAARGRRKASCHDQPIGRAP
jgi:hypothetical protein